MVATEEKPEALANGSVQPSSWQRSAPSRPIVSAALHSSNGHPVME
jgi:hypothetical protein